MQFNCICNKSLNSRKACIYFPRLLKISASWLTHRINVKCRYESSTCKAVTVQRARTSTDENISVRKSWNTVSQDPDIVRRLIKACRSENQRNRRWKIETVSNFLRNRLKFSSLSWPKGFGSFDVTYPIRRPRTGRGIGLQVNRVVGGLTSSRCKYSGMLGIPVNNRGPSFTVWMSSRAAMAWLTNTLPEIRKSNGLLESACSRCFPWPQKPFHLSLLRWFARVQDEKRRGATRTKRCI